MKVTGIYKTYINNIKAKNCIIKEKWKIKTSDTAYLLQFDFYMNISYCFCCKRHLLSLLSLFGFTLFLFHFFLVLFILLHSYFFSFLLPLVFLRLYEYCLSFLPSAHSCYPLLLFLFKLPLVPLSLAHFSLPPFLFLFIYQR